MDAVRHSVSSRSVVVQGERARGRRLRERRRLLVDRAGEYEDHAFDVADNADAGAERVGWDGGPRVGELRNAVLAHASRNVQKPRQCLWGGWRPRAGAGGMKCRHFVCAVLNAGDVGFIPALVWKRKSPPAFGSGKLGTPLARMHLARASASESRALGEDGPNLTHRPRVRKSIPRWSYRPAVPRSGWGSFLRIPSPAPHPEGSRR